MKTNEGRKTLSARKFIRSEDRKARKRREKAQFATGCDHGRLWAEQLDKSRASQANGALPAPADFWAKLILADRMPRNEEISALVGLAQKGNRAALFWTPIAGKDWQAIVTSEYRDGFIRGIRGALEAVRKS